MRTLERGFPSPALGTAGGSGGRACQVGAEEVNRSPATSDIHQLLLVTKAPAAREALLQVAPRLAAGAVVIILCNGALALHEEISEMPASQRWHLMCGLTTHGAWSKADFEVVHAGAGDTIFGQYGAVRMSEETYESTLAQLLAAGLGGRHEAHIERSLWLKLAANAAINPLTALLEKNNGCILEEEQISRCKEICKEVAAVAAASWHQQGFASLCPSAAEMEDFALDTARRTSPNRSSMLQDVLAERPTEIDYLNGWLVTKARTFGLEVAENAQLTALIKEKERRFLEPKAADAGKEVSDSNAPVVLKRFAATCCNGFLRGSRLRWLRDVNPGSLVMICEDTTPSSLNSILSRFWSSAHFSHFFCAKPCKTRCHRLYGHLLVLPASCSFLSPFFGAPVLWVGDSWAKQLSARSSVEMCSSPLTVTLPSKGGLGCWILSRTPAAQRN